MRKLFFTTVFLAASIFCFVALAEENKQPDPVTSPFINEAKEFLFNSQTGVLWRTQAMLGVCNRQDVTQKILDKKRKDIDQEISEVFYAIKKQGNIHGDLDDFKESLEFLKTVYDQGLADGVQHAFSGNPPEEWCSGAVYMATEIAGFH